MIQKRPKSNKKRPKNLYISKSQKAPSANVHSLFFLPFLYTDVERSIAVHSIHISLINSL